MSIRCLICAERDAGYRYACDHDIRAIQKRLREIGTYWTDALPALTAPSRSGMAGRGTPGYGSRSPVNDDVVVARDFRSKANRIGPDDDPDPRPSLSAGIRDIALWIRDEFEEQAPRRWTVTTEIAYLLGQIDRSACSRWIVELELQIRQLHSQARTLAHDQPPAALGKCITVDCEGDVYPATLKGPKGPEEGGRCNAGHRREYSGTDFIRLLVAVAQEAS